MITLDMFQNSFATCLKYTAMSSWWFNQDENKYSQVFVPNYILLQLPCNGRSASNYSVKYNNKHPAEV